MAGDFSEWLTGALGSAYSAALPEMVGLEPLPFVQRFRQENPVSGFGTQALGFAVPYLGYEKAAMSIPSFAKAIGQVGAKSASPVMARGMQEVVKFAPFEAGRLATTAAVGGDMGQSAVQAALSLGIGGLAASGFKAFEQAMIGKAVRPSAVAVDKALPLQDQLSKVIDDLGGGLVKDTEAAQLQASQLRKEILSQRSNQGHGQRGLWGLEDADLILADPELPKARRTAIEGALGALNNLFKVGETPGMSRKLFLPGKAPYQMAEDLFNTKFAPLAGNEQNMLYPRFLVPKTKEAAINMDQLYNGMLREGSDGWRWGKDKKDGLFLLMKKDPDGTFTMFKTKTPGVWLKGNETWRKAITDTTKSTYAKSGNPGRVLSEDVNANSVVYDTAARMKALPNIDYTGLDKRTSPVQYTLKKLGLDKVRDNDAVQDAVGLARDVLMPTFRVFGHSPIAKRVFESGVAAKSAAEGFAERLFIGQRLHGAKTPIRAIFSNKGLEPHPTSVAGLLETMSRAELDSVQKALFANAAHPDLAVQQYNLTQNGLSLMRAIKESFAKSADSVAKTTEGSGIKSYIPTEAQFKHWLTWNGSWNVPIHSGDGKIVGMVVRERPKEALDLATKIAGRSPTADWFVGKPFASGSMARAMSILKGLDDDMVRSFGKIYNEVAGPHHKDIFRQNLFNWFRNQQLHNAEMAIRGLFDEEMGLLAHADSATANTLRSKMETMWGKQSPIEKTINRATDRVLAKFMGANSASKIVQTVNKGLFHLTFGFWNLAYNMANLLTTAQTGLPHLMYLTKAAPERIMRYYSYFPVERQSGMKDAMGVLSIGKLTAQSFRDMANPDPGIMKHFTRAMEEGVVAPRFVEEWVGQQSITGQKIANAMAGDEPITGLIGTVSTLLPSAVEKLTRGHAFLLGRRFFHDIAGVTDEEQLYQLAKQFVTNTQYLYGVEHRPSIFTGPIGSTIGLFKNWMMHYMAWMMEYAGEGALRGNWSPMLWMAAGTQAIGGLGGLGPINLMAQGINGMFSDESLMKNTYDAFGEMADPIYFGLPAGLGVSLQNQVAMPGSDPSKEARMFWDLMVLDRAKYLGMAWDKAWAHNENTGENPLADAEARRMLMRAVAPKALYQTFAGMQDGAVSSFATGYPVKNMDPMESTLYRMGFQPLELAKYYKVSDELWRNQQALRAGVQALGKEWAEAAKANDFREMSAIERQAMLMNLPLDSVLKSGKARLAKTQEETIPSRYPQEKVLQYRMAELLE